MVCRERARSAFDKLVKYWEFCVVDSNGQSIGFLCA